MCLIYSEGLETINARKIWLAALGQLQLEIPRPNYETWLKPTIPSSLENDTLIISTPSPFAAEMLEKRLSGTIHRTVSRVAGRELTVEFTVQGSASPATLKKQQQTISENVKSQTIKQNETI